MSENVPEFVNGLPDNPTGRRLKAQHLLWAAVQDTAKTLGSSEAAAEAKRIGRFLGFVEKMNRGPRSSQSADTVKDTPAETPKATAPSKAPAGFGTKPKQ